MEMVALMMLIEHVINFFSKWQCPNELCCVHAQIENVEFKECLSTDTKLSVNESESGLFLLNADVNAMLIKWSWMFIRPLISLTVSNV